MNPGNIPRDWFPDISFEAKNNLLHNYSHHLLPGTNLSKKDKSGSNSHLE
jgi:hypothetical protein